MTYIKQLIVVREKPFYGEVKHTRRNRQCQLKGTVTTPFGDRVRVIFGRDRVWRVAA